MYRFILLLLSSICTAIRYDNFTLYRGVPMNKIHLEFLTNLTERIEVNFWREPGSLRMPVEFVIAPSLMPTFVKEAKRTGIYLTKIMDNVQSAFDQQIVKPYIRRYMQSFDWQSFYRTDDIYTWLRDLESIYAPELKVECIGTTHEGREILAATVILKNSKRRLLWPLSVVKTNSPNPLSVADTKRSKVMIEGGIHAREWIAPAFVTYMIHQILVSNNSSNNNLKKISNTYEWYFVPILNPDGYEHSHVKDRLWRKNCNGDGTDLNRNFAHMFGTTGVSFQPLSPTYCGRFPFSEKESIAMKEFIESKSENLEYYLAFHSYGQYMIMPYAHLKYHSENYNEMKIMGKKAAQVIQKLNGKKYKVGTAFDTVGYTVSGASTCWTKHNFKVPYVMTFELRDEGQYGFALPTTQIVETCEETLAGLLVLLQPTAKNFEKVKMKYDLTYESDVLSAQNQIELLNTAIIFSVLCIIIL